MRATLLGAIVSTQQLWLACVAVALAAGCAALMRFTRFGLATRASAENEQAGVLLGLRPGVIAA